MQDSSARLQYDTQDIASLTALSVVIAFSRGLHYNGYKNLFDEEEVALVDHLIKTAISETPNWFHRNLVKVMQHSPYTMQQAFFSKFGVSGYDQQIVSRKFMVRHRIEKAIAQGVGQIIILGGGYDSAAFCLSKKHSNVNFYELDRGATRYIKIKALADILNTTTQNAENDFATTIFHENLYYARCDLAKDNLLDILEKNNFNSKKDTLVIAEGLTMYLAEHDIKKLLQSIHSLLGDNNEMILSFFYSKTLYSSQVADRMQRLSNEQYRFALPPDKVFGFAADFDFLVEEKILGVDLLMRIGDIADATLRRDPNAPSEDYYSLRKSRSMQKNIDKCAMKIPDMAFDIPIAPEQRITNRPGFCTII